MYIYYTRVPVRESQRQNRGIKSIYTNLHHAEHRQDEQSTVLSVYVAVNKRRPERETVGSYT